MALRLRIMTPVKKLFDSEVEYAGFEAVDGSVGIMEGHTPLAAVLKKGAVRYLRGGTEGRIDVNGGFAKVMPDAVCVFAGPDA